MIARARVAPDITEDADVEIWETGRDGPAERTGCGFNP